MIPVNIFFVFVSIICLSVGKSTDESYGCPTVQVTCTIWCRFNDRRYGVCQDDKCNCFYNKADELQARPWQRGCPKNPTYCNFWCKKIGFKSGTCYWRICKCGSETGEINES